MEEAFDKGQVVIVPYDGSNDGQRWKIQVVNKPLLGPDEEGGQWGLPWQNYHNMELDFRGATTWQVHRCLYAHYITTLVRTYRLIKNPGWQLMVEDRREQRV